MLKKMALTCLLAALTAAPLAAQACPPATYSTSSNDTLEGLPAWDGLENDDELDLDQLKQLEIETGMNELTFSQKMVLLRAFLAAKAGEGWLATKQHVDRYKEVYLAASVAAVACGLAWYLLADSNSSCGKGCSHKHHKHHKHGKQ